MTLLSSQKRGIFPYRKESRQSYIVRPVSALLFTCTGLVLTAQVRITPRGVSLKLRLPVFYPPKQPTLLGPMPRIIIAAVAERLPHRGTTRRDSAWSLIYPHKSAARKKASLHFHPTNDKTEAPVAYIACQSTYLVLGRSVIQHTPFPSH